MSFLKLQRVTVFCNPTWCMSNWHGKSCNPNIFLKEVWHVSYNMTCKEEERVAQQRVPRNPNFSFYYSGNPMTYSDSSLLVQCYLLLSLKCPYFSTTFIEQWVSHFGAHFESISEQDKDCCMESVGLASFMPRSDTSLLASSTEYFFLVFRRCLLRWWRGRERRHCAVETTINMKEKRQGTTYSLPV